MCVFNSLSLSLSLCVLLCRYCSDEGVFHAEKGSLCANAFCQVMQLLYDSDVVSEEAILAWAEEKGSAEEDDKVFLEKAQPFLAWLEEADSDEYESEEYSEDESDED